MRTSCGVRKTCWPATILRMICLSNGWWHNNVDNLNSRIAMETIEFLIQQIIDAKWFGNIHDIYQFKYLFETIQTIERQTFWSIVSIFYLRPKILFFFSFFFSSSHSTVWQLPIELCAVHSHTHSRLHWLTVVFVCLDCRFWQNDKVSTNEKNYEPSFERHVNSTLRCLYFLFDRNNSTNSFAKIDGKRWFWSDLCGGHAGKHLVNHSLLWTYPILGLSFVHASVWIDDYDGQKQLRQPHSSENTNQIKKKV